jgi:trimeric autotransporter adhesin
MKKVIFTMLLACLVSISYGQRRYFWTGGTSGVWNASTSWNTVLNGSGTARSSADAGDTLVFDGGNIGGTIAATGTATPDIQGSYTWAQLLLQNNADVVFRRSTNGGTVSGTSAMTINGDGATNTDDLAIDASSKLTITSNTTSYGMNLSLGVTTTNLATGTIAGKVFILDGGFATCRLSVQNTSALNFVNGSICYSNTSFAASYPFGSATQGVVGGVNFKTGSQFIFQGGLNPFASSTHNPFYFERGSSFIMEAANAAATFTNRTFANVIIRNNASVILAENFYGIDTLTINAGSTFNYRATGTAPIAGNIVNNGTFGAATGATSSHLILIGTTPQSIGGTGVFNAVGAMSVATNADVTLNTNITIGSTSGTPTSNITGKLNVQGFTINSTGATTPGPISLRAAASATNVAGTLTSGSNLVVLNSGNYSTSNVAIGALVSGAGIQPNSYIIATSSASFQFTISKPATATTAADGAVLSIVTNSPTLTTTNTAGIDGSLTTTGTRTFGTGTNYVFGAATVSPFTISSNNATGNVIFNAAATTNKTQNIGGTLTLGTGKLTIRNTDTLRILNGAAIAGGPFSATKYISLQNSASTVGVLRNDGFTAATLFPVGSASNYLPVTLTPTAIDTFCVSVFEGITNDGTAAGTAMLAAQKAKVVDAVWTINRNSNIAQSCGVNLSWIAALEGSSFSAYTNSQVGIGRYNGATWDNVIGSGDNTANTATATFSSFSPFSVGQVGSPLPVQFTNVSASVNNRVVTIVWKTQNEQNIIHYEVEKSTNGVSFSSIATVAAQNILAASYNSVDAQPFAGANYYRIKSTGKNGEVKYTAIVKVNTDSKGKNEMVIYPNPVKNKIVTLQLTGVDADDYQVSIVNNNGQQVFTQKMGAIAGNKTITLALPQTITAGMYRLVVKGNSNQLQQTIIVE